MGRIIMLEVSLLVLTVSFVYGQSIPIVPEDEEIDEEESEQRYEVLRELTLMQRVDARFDVLRLPGMTHARARAIVSRLGSGQFRIDSIAGASSIQDSAQAPSRMAEFIPAPAPRTALTLRSASSYNSSRGTSSDAWVSKHLLRWNSRSDDGSRVNVDVSMPASARQRSIPRFYAFATVAERGITAVVGEFRSRGRHGVLEDINGRMISLTDVLSLSGDTEPFGKTSLLEQSATVKGVGMSIIAEDLTTLTGIFGSSRSSGGKGAMQEFSLRRAMTPESQLGFGLLRLPSGRTGTTFSLATLNDQSTSTITVLVRPDEPAAYIVSGSSDFGKDLMVACALHTSGVSLGFRWGLKRHVHLEAFWSGDRFEEGESRWSTIRMHTLQLNVGDPSGPTERIRLRRTIVRWDGENPSAERSLLHATATSTVPFSKRSSVSVHAQALFLQEDRMNNSSSVIILSARHDLDLLTLRVWVSSFRSVTGGTLWWQHPGYGSWPVSAAFSGSGSRAGLHVTRARIRTVECSAYIVFTRRESSKESEISGGLMMESRL